jgi:hypothetical protein
MDPKKLGKAITTTPMTGDPQKRADQVWAKAQRDTASPSKPAKR